MISSGAGTGSGLGLAISRKLVLAMGGELKVDSVPGRGSAFSFTVDLRRSEAGPATAVAETGPARSLSILVVDDLEANRIVAAGLLNSLGHRPHAVPGGAQALEALRLGCYDAVLMDLHMPGLGGMEVFRRIRNLEGAAARLPVFLMTADTERVLLQACLAAGIEGVIAKPIRKARLAALLSGVSGLEEGCAGGDEVLVDLLQVRRILADLGLESWREGVAACRASAAESLDQLEGPDPVGARQALHRLAGLAGTFGLARLYRLVRHAESLLEAGAPWPRQELQALLAASLTALDTLPVQAMDCPGRTPVQPMAMRPCPTSP